MASIENQILFIAYIILAAVIAMIYGMRRIFLLENNIIRLEKSIIKSKTKRKSTAKRKTSRKKAKKKNTRRKKTKRR